MSLSRFSVCCVVAAAIMAGAEGCAAADGNDSAGQGAAARYVGGPRLGTSGGGPVIDKTGDAVLQAMIAETLPKFKRFKYVDAATGDTLKYNLFVPADVDASKRYPLVLFMADASTPGADYDTPLTQGYGALVWATAESQAQNPCYVLVPQFSGVAVNDAYEHTPEVDKVIRLLDDVVKSNNVDSRRLYTTGQSMGGMISMYFNIAYPDVFAASLFVDCHWDTSKFGSLADKKFVYVTAGKSGKSYGNIGVLKELLKSRGVDYTFAEWSARLPQAEQDTLAAGLLAKGAPVNMIMFSPGSVLPDDGRGSEHMYSFDYAYKLKPVRDWLFLQSK